MTTISRNFILLIILALDAASVKSDSEFAFDEEIYAHVIKSTSKPDSPLFHIKAPYCKYGKLEYKILERDHPFKISTHNGSIYLPHNLDPNSPTTFTFTVRANDAKLLCLASTQVHVFVVHVNEHKPIMSSAKYYCTVNENERIVKIKPEIRATDKDDGQAGKIRAIRIREKDVPFKVVMQSNGFAMLVATEDLDAESISEYRFNIYAVDNGTRARKSERSRVYCDVIDVNEFAPIFKHPMYDIEVFRGKVYRKIIQLEAIDRDISSKNGKICKYTIIEKDLPFSLDNSGILSLQEELPEDYPSNLEFHVRATDCANKNSDDDAVVRVKIKDEAIIATPGAPVRKQDCKPGVMVKDVISIQYPSCTKHLQLLPNVPINDCHDKEDHDISVRAVLDSSLVRKGCERPHGPVMNIYSDCGAKSVVELLPYQSTNWIEDVFTEETVQGEINHVFEGNFAARLPKDILGKNWQESFTIAAWALVKKSPQPQFILSLSDGMKFGYSYVGLYAVNKPNDRQPRIGFYMSKENGKCRFHEEWEVALDNFKWRHIAVVVDKCNLQLQVDGFPVEPIGVEENLQPQQTHIQPKYVIGGRWLDTNQKYTDFFKGKISQMVFTKKVIKNFQCILRCQEKVDLQLPLPEGFQLERIRSKGSLTVTGRGPLSYLRNILSNIVYLNREPYPTPVRRSVQIESTINGKVLSSLNVNVEIRKNDVPDIKLIGRCNNQIKTYGSLDSGMRVCPDISIKVDGCLKMIDEALIVINSDIIGTGNVSVPNSLLRQFGLTASFTSSLLRISGVARYFDYMEVLSNVVYIPSLVARQKKLDIKIEVSAENGRFSSNELVVGVNVKGEISNEAKDTPMVYFLHSKSHNSAGNLIIDKNKNSNRGKGVVIISVVLSLAVVVAVAGFGILKLHRRNRDDVPVEMETRATELLWDDEGLTMNITMNPLLRFRHDSSLSDGHLSENSQISLEESSEASLYWSESEDDNDSDHEVKNSLEWDSSYNEEFGDGFVEYGEKVGTNELSEDLLERSKETELLSCDNPMEATESNL